MYAESMSRERRPMDNMSRPTCPKCKSESVFRVTTTKGAKETLNCATCKNQWIASEADELLNPAI
jgi:ssDNA-binding Zn-finger/Zn-ribbon topoisomerase 1